VCGGESEERDTLRAMDFGYSNVYKLNQLKPRPYLNDIVQVRFTIGSRSMQYKTDFDVNDVTYLLLQLILFVPRLTN